MSTLLWEIENYDACAAFKLRKAGFQSDLEIQTLTLEDLHDLFPGQKKLKLRNTIFKIFHKQNQIDQFLEKLEDVSQRDSIRDFVIKECFNRIENTKEQLDEKQTVLKCHNDIPKDISKSLDSEKEMDFQTDSVVQILCREDLRELFPEPEYLKLRRTIFQIIHDQTPAHLLLEELKGFTQQNSFYDAPVARFLERIKNTKKQLDDMQIVLEDLNIILKDRSKGLDSGKDVPVAESIENTKKPLDDMWVFFKDNNNMLQDRSKSWDSGEDTNASMTASEIQKKSLLDKKKSISQEKGGVTGFFKGFPWFSGSSQKTKDSSSDTNAPLTSNEKQKKNDLKKKREVRFKVEVSGQTFGADQQLLDEIKTPDLKWIEGEKHNITIVFCPVVSRNDAEVAIRKVPDGDPVILVLMHYSQEPKHVSSSKVLSSYSNVVLEVNIFYHNRKNGLLKCRQNENAVIELKEELKKYSRPQSSG